MRIHILTFFLLLLSTVFTKAQDYQFEKISIEEGLSQSIVLNIFQDSKGFLWISTQEGLNKYDGYKFIHYKKEPGSNNSLSDSYTRAVVEDSENNLWIATNQGGLNKFNPENETFLRYMHDKTNQESIAGNNITALEKDADENLWIGTNYNGLDYFDRQTGKFIHYTKEQYAGLLDNHITTLFYDRSGKYLWVGTHSGLNILELSTNKFIDLNNILFPPNNSGNLWIRKIYQDKNSNVWIGTDAEGLFKISGFTSPENINKEKIHHFKHQPGVKGSISENSINAICETVEGEIFIGVWGGGLNKVIENKTTGKISFKVWLNNPENQSSLTENDINFITQDKSGVLWIGTYGNGLNKVSPHSVNFVHYKNNPNTKNSLSDNHVTSVLEDDNKSLWIGTWRGINKFDKKKNLFTNYTNSAEQKIYSGGERVTSIIKDRKGYLWFGTLDNGLSKYNSRTGEFVKFKNDPENPNSIVGNRILSLLEAKDGKIWIGTYYSGICFYDPVKNNFTKLYTDSLENFDNRVNKLYEDTEGNIWIATYRGIYKYYPAENYIENIKIKNNTGDVFFTHGILSLTQDKQNNIWIGTFGNGIYKLNYPPENGSYAYKKFSLPNNYVFALQFDSNGNLWVSTRNGIAKFNSAANTFEPFTNYEGVEFKEFLDGSFYNGTDGNLYFCSMQGLLEFNPSKIKVNYSEPGIEITQLKIFNKPVKFGTYRKINDKEQIENIILNYSENSISLEFAALNFIAPQSIVYEYKLEGFDENYIKTEAGSRTATYTNLPSGEYVFKIKVYLGTNTGVSYEKKIGITVIPPFWETAWFRILAVMLFIFVLYVIYNLRTVSIRNRNEELQKEVKLRTKELEEINSAKDKFFSIIAHDLKGPFSYLLSNSEFLAKEIHNINKEDAGFLSANINLATGNIYNLLENLLQWSKFQMMGLKPEPKKINLTELIKTNLDLFQPHAEQKKIKVTENALPEIIMLSDENIINTILRNLLMNAIKFTREDGSINVTAKKENNNVIIRVADTGIGMSAAQINEILYSKSVVSSQGTRNEKGTGLGLYLIKEFIDAMHGELKIESEKNKGTAVTCVIPAE